jgi:cyclohexanone monooxygenase
MPSFDEIPEFDPGTLRVKYRAERDKRLRPDGNAQYLATEGNLASYLADPYLGAPLERDPATVDADVVIVGAGISAVVIAARLRDVGITDIWVIDKAGGFGGTWYWNRYPAAMCDIESYIYLPLLEETGYIPSRKYVYATEIREHIERCAHYLDLEKSALLQTALTGATWDEASARWSVSTDRDDTIRARFLIVPSGQLLRPKLPGIPGIESFQGHSFHTSRWDYAYTGGDIYGNLTGLLDKRVGIIGTGATAVQCIPPVGDTAGHLYVFQRTPCAVDFRNNKPTPPGWSSTLTPGWQYRRMGNFTAIIDGRTVDEDLVSDGWTAMNRELTSGTIHHLSARERASLLELADFQVMERIRARIDAEISDPIVAEALKPWYARWCKRPLFHDEYLPTFNRPNVTLVDTDGRGPERITETSVVVDGRAYEIDCLVFATGFEVGTRWPSQVGFDITGRDGTTLGEKWATGPQSLHGVQTSGFPNAFFIRTAHTGLTPNFTHMVEEQSRHIAYIMSKAIDLPQGIVEVRPQAEEAWGAEIDRLGQRGKSYHAECTPSYTNSEGRPDDPNSLFAKVYGGGPVTFFELLAQWRNRGDLEGLEFRCTATEPVP